jgi:hypothetical protein
MADGSILNSEGGIAYRHEPLDPRLEDLADDRSLHGSCNCGWEGPVDLSLWNHGELRLYVSTVARHLRCIGCGGRSVMLTVRRAPPSPGPLAFLRWR